MALPVPSKERGELRIKDNLDELATELADYVAEVSEVSVRERGHFSLALSGGSLIILMRQLSTAPYNQTLDWDKWHVFFADERVVAKTHVDSNYKLVKQEFLSKVPVISSHIHSINDSLSAEDAASQYEFSLRQFVKSRIVDVSEISDCPKFDLVLLGIGPDGHVASLFPNHSALDEKDDWVTFITDSPKPPPERITFTLPVINSSANVAVVATGDSKADALHLAIDDVGADCPLIPARMVQPANGKLVWFLDSAAASKLNAFQNEEFVKPPV